MKQKKHEMRIILMVLGSFCITACGKMEEKDWKTEPEHESEDVKEPEHEIKEDETSDNRDIDNVVMAYITENIEYSDEVIPVQYVDDLSLLEDMKYADSTYVYQDGKVYYRRYHGDSYEEAALWGMYGPIPETGKEIVCIDSDGTVTELFADKGYGDMYLINNRFYMTDGRMCEEDGTSYVETRLYSVDMQGKDRIDYGNGKILAIDKERNMIIFQMREQGDLCYYAMNYETGEKKRVLKELDDEFIDVHAYRDGWIYYERWRIKGGGVARLCAVSLEGEQREIIALTSYINQQPNSYGETILHVEVDEERIYFTFGGYDGSAQVFQGGKLISVKLDGTDYKAVEISEEAFYLCHDGGKTMVYFIDYPLLVNDSRKRYNTLVWDVDEDICYLSEFPQNILHKSGQMAGIWSYYPADKSALCELTLYEAESEKIQTSIYAIPDDSGKIVKVAKDLKNCIPKGENEEPGRIQELYYADGFLYFTVEYNIYDEETSIGWRDGYRRLHTDVYRLKTGESAAQMLYSY